MNYGNISNNSHYSEKLLKLSKIGKFFKSLVQKVSGSFSQKCRKTQKEKLKFRKKHNDLRSFSKNLATHVLNISSFII